MPLQFAPFKSNDYRPHLTGISVLLCCVIAVIFFGYTKPAEGTNPNRVTFDKQNLPADEISGKHSYTLTLLTSQFNKQTGYDALLLDGNRVVTVIRLDSACNLTRALDEDNMTRLTDDVLK